MAMPTYHNSSSRRTPGPDGSSLGLRAEWHGCTVASFGVPARNTIIIFPPRHYIEINGHRCLFPVPHPVLRANGAVTQNSVIGQRRYWRS